MTSKRARGGSMQYDPERQAEELLAKSLQLETGNLMQVYEGIRRRLLDEGQLRSARCVEGTDGKRKAMCLKAGCRGCESGALAPLRCSNITAPPCFQLDHLCSSSLSGRAPLAPRQMPSPRPRSRPTARGGSRYAAITPSGAAPRVKKARPTSRGEAPSRSTVP